MNIVRIDERMTIRILDRRVILKQPIFRAVKMVIYDGLLRDKCLTTILRAWNEMIDAAVNPNHRQRNPDQDQGQSLKAQRWHSGGRMPQSFVEATHGPYPYIDRFPCLASD